MTPAKEKEHEPTAVHREMTEKITEGGKEVPNPEVQKNELRKSGMVKKELLVLLKLVMNMDNVWLNKQIDNYRPA